MAFIKCTFVAVVVAVAVIATISSVSLAQPAGGQGTRPGGFGQGGFFGAPGGGGMTELLQSSSVREELELVDDQVEKIRALQRRTGEESQTQFRELFQGFRELSEDEQQKRREQIQTKLAEARKKLDTELQEILLPHQYERLKQIQVQAAMRRGGTAAALQSDDVASSLNLTDEQKEKLRETGREAQQELEKQMEELRAKMREKILGVLTAEQRKKLDELSGKPFEMRDGFGGGGFGGAGGFGGGRTGGRGDRGGERGGNNNN